MLSLLIPGECFTAAEAHWTDKMDNIRDLKYQAIPPDSPYVTPHRMTFIQNGKLKYWDFLQVHDIVVVIIYNTTRKKLILVRQFRPAVYHGQLKSANVDFNDIDFEKYPPSMGITIELCAGLIDKKGLSKKEIAREEILEECGYDVSLDQIEEIFEFNSNVQSSSGKQTLFYCEVTDEQKVSEGGGIQNEIIDVVELSIEEVSEKMGLGTCHNTPASSMLGILWFLSFKAPQLCN
uniref:Uridine diphosphate glucose pyrophosphatase NUDT14 n=1 Tax=Culicoides sonorensis TaxID=179676 RepID=A0A336KQ54_CULSO